MASADSDPHGAFPPREIARRVERLGVAKARSDATTIVVLAILAGAFIALGALLFIVVTTGSSLGLGITRLVGGVAFSLGLILVVVAGAELFTGNNLLAMAWASRLITGRSLVRNWALVYLGNVIGAVSTAAVVVVSGVDALGDDAVRATAVRIAEAKAALPVGEAFARGVLCNALVCLAVWLAMGGRSVSDKVIAIVPPIAAFVAIGFEHSIANWFLLPYGMALAEAGAVPLDRAARNLVAATAGNIVGGTLLVAGVYWLAYLRPRLRTP